jgi:hypothetical protein
MTTTINADNGVVSGSAGLKSSADSSGVLALQTNGTTAVTVDTSQNVGIGSTTAKKFVVNQTGATGYFLSGEASGTEIAYWYYDANAIQFSSKSAGRALTFLTADTERMRISSAGLVTMTYQPSFLSSGSTTAASGSLSSWNTPQNNVGSAFNTTNGRFTAPVAGRYMFLGNMSCNSVTVGQWTGFGFMINGAGSNFGVNYNTASTTNDTGVNSCVVLQLSAGDYVQMWLANQGSWFNVYTMSGYLLG